MRQSSRLISAVFVVLAAAVLVLSVPTAWANHQQPLSVHHTNYGVSQLLAGFFLNSGSSVQLGIYNPYHFTHIMAALVYERLDEAGGFPGEDEVWQTCEVRRLTPHAAIDIAVDNANTLNYVEVFSVPETAQPVPAGAGAAIRIADGFGLNGAQILSKGFHDYLRPAHPLGGSLPSDSVVPGQNAAAKACVCAGLAALSPPANKNTFGPAALPGIPWAFNCP